MASVQITKLFYFLDGAECIEIDGEEVPYVSTFQVITKLYLFASMFGRLGCWKLVQRFRVYWLINNGENGTDTGILLYLFCIVKPN